MIELQLTRRLQAFIFFGLLAFAFMFIGVGQAEAYKLVDRNGDGVTDRDDLDINAQLTGRKDILLTVTALIDPERPGEEPFYDRTMQLALVDGDVSDDNWEYTRDIAWWGEGNGNCRVRVTLFDGNTPDSEGDAIRGQIRELPIGDPLRPGNCDADIATEDLVGSDNITIQINKDDISSVTTVYWFDENTLYVGPSDYSQPDENRFYEQTSANPLLYIQQAEDCPATILVDESDRSRGTFTNCEGESNSIVIGNAEEADTPDGQNGGSEGSGFEGEIVPTCESLNPGLGWILCQVLRNALDVLDSILGWFVNILEINFAEDQRDVLESVWRGFRAIANVGFAFAFIFIIYSAASGGLLSSYDVKRMLPRLLLGAIFVQVSLDIALFLIDLFNVFGKGAADLILAPLPGEGNDGIASFVAPQSPLGGSDGLTDIIAELALSIFIVVMLLVAAFFSITGVITMAVVFLLRNMFIVILVVLSPLAFVAWILPNTEGYFKKWWGFFIQLLMIYPIAAVFLASGRLIGAIWIGTGGGSEASINAGNVAGRFVGTIAIFAPYFIAPKMFSLAGSAIGSIANGVDGVKRNVNDREGVQRAKTKAKAGEITSGKGRIGRGINRTVGGAANIRPTKAGRRRAKYRAEGAYQKINQEDKQGARLLFAKEFSHLSSEERRDRFRDIAMDNGESEGRRQAALEQMLTTNDIAGLEQVYAQAQNNRSTRETFARFTDDKGSEVNTKARHLIHPSGTGAVATAPAETIVTQKGATLNTVINGNEEANIDAATPAQLRALAETYAQEIHSNRDLRSRMSSEDRQLLVDLANSHGVALVEPPS